MASDGIMNDQSSPFDQHEEGPLASPSSQQPRNSDDDESSIISPVTSPPYWFQSHQRSVSNISVESGGGQITLQDNTDGTDVKNEACWAKSVTIEDYTRVKGNRSAIGAFVVWNITMETLHVCCNVWNGLGIGLTSAREATCVFARGTPNLMH